jgi:AcrR family transcriptional regulator
MTRTKSTSEARSRILETADRLFYQEGIRAVGIDRIIAEASVAKMTLYAHFSSKDDLIVAVLKHREESILEHFQVVMAREQKVGRAPLESFFVALREWFSAPGFRGCAFQNACAELADPSHPGSLFVRGHKERFDQFLHGLVDEAIGSTGSTVADAVSMLVEGAIVTAVINHTPGAAEIARDAAMQLVARAKGE